ncbi:prophage LambdaSa2%2C protease [Streptococcus pneumoniae]|uniref:HK97 family phage prohead protease n=1 Tax=Stutzerimonas stutzeri TaxID=316 RepID=UPI0005E6CB3F|nr:HK97 family phage prohead protease [Stutzerimonas stutzeri]RRV39451.1 HK97 family phage prohead protease [Stutzerimonas stutzeri]RRW14286.1 HK97 family phage prohead protease [Stutzerimonas stutzeri]CJK78788.1 prophage LambdaSa2%2C protease [Streptococcus pneumoniae]HAJ88499.1 HK97 family phage prohead protease [Pseudomonas sp.]
MRAFQAAPIQFKFSAGDEAGTFSGIASPYGGEPDAHGDLIAPGAYTKTLAQHEAKGTRPALLWQHDQSNPVGVWLKFEDTPEGLLAHGKLTTDVPQAKAAHALMRDGALALSIGYMIPAGGAEIKNGARLLKQIDLVEVSLVALPANTSARITSVKSFDPVNPNPRDFERSVRDALGLSAREAKRLMAGGWNGLVRDEQPDDSAELAAIAAKLQSITQALQGQR